VSAALQTARSPFTPVAYRPSLERFSEVWLFWFGKHHDPKVFVLSRPNTRYTRQPLAIMSSCV
jgi:hypothetical protein